MDFLLDTNTIRFKYGASEAPAETIKAVENFFQYTDALKDVYNFVVPWQVGSELRIYIYRIRNNHQENSDFQDKAGKVEKYIKDIDFVNSIEDYQLEEDIRIFFEYLNSKYKFLYEDGTKIKLKGLKSDDARILLTAIQEDHSIVTNNVKDFIPILAFEKAIWDPVNDKIYWLSPDSARVFYEDENIKQWVERIRNKFSLSVPIEKEKNILEAIKKDRKE
ncbi:hypothetical protein [Paenisporosarcina sp. TG20]|uniref:hypothetical protein n=1 Tax=Paenisporosarcina sp. TG20 TaxID=1211706 RepID=UPI0002E56BC5|nr:hypothetical protein [Paenisporosarcina sp. TG20]